MLGCRNSNQQSPVKEVEPSQRRKLENNLEKQVIFPKEDNSNNPEQNQDDVKAALLSQEREDDSEQIVKQEEAEPSVPRDLTPTPLDDEVKGGAVDRPQRTRRPPIWFGDFVVGSDLDQSSGSQHSNKYLTAVTMAQQQLDQPL